MRNIAASAILTVSLCLPALAGQAKSVEAESSLFATPLKEIEEAAEQLQEFAAGLIVERRNLDASIAEFAPILEKYAGLRTQEGSKRSASKITKLSFGT